MRCCISFVVAVVSSGPQGADDPRVLAALQKSQATFTRDDKLPGRPVVAVNLCNCDFSDSSLELLSKLPHLREMWT